MREDEDQHAEMIHFLRNNTQLSRFSRAEVRDFIERLAVEGYAITLIAKPVEELTPMPPEELEEHAAVMRVMPCGPSSNPKIGAANSKS